MSAAVSLPSFAVRLAMPTDMNFIRTCWRGSQREQWGRIEGVRYAQNQDAAMNAILGRPSTCVFVAHAAEDPDTIAGFLIARPGAPVLHKGPGRFPTREIGPAPVVHFIFVRKEARRIGIARMLLGDLTERRDVVYTTRPAQERRFNEQTGANEWLKSDLRIPNGWSYSPRSQFVEVN
jgi:GNAT superfamily N-acetyltransferase